MIINLQRNRFKKNDILFIINIYSLILSIELVNLGGFS